MTYRTPDHRARAVESVLDIVSAANRIVLVTHVNADGDGAGSQAAMASWLHGRGREARIVNPTLFPDVFRFLLDRDEWALPAGSEAAAEFCASADLALVLDTSEVSRLGRSKPLVDHLPKVIIDHHVPSDNPIEGSLLRDERACATGELVYDLLLRSGDDISGAAALGTYVAIMTDTGSFRFGNTTPGAHEIAGELIALGVDPEDTHRRVYGDVPIRRYRLLQAALAELEVDADYGMAWMTVPAEAYELHGQSAEDLEGFVDYPRSLAGVEVAVLFRTTSSGDTKVSLRSNGSLDVNRVARRFGGGGHVRASGAMLRGPVPENRRALLDAVRAEIEEQSGGALPARERGGPRDREVPRR